MCQMSIFVEKGDNEALLKENVTRLEILDSGVRVSTLFEGPTDLDNMAVRFIDFTAGKVLLEKQ